MIDLGRVVAYYPGLKRMTGTINSAILLCQLIYLCSKSKDSGWVSKDSDELEEDTGLTYYEQRTARKILTDMNLIEERENRLIHKIAFKVNEDVLNALWEELHAPQYTPEKKEQEQKQEKEKVEEIKTEILKEVKTSGSPVSLSSTSERVRRTDAVVKGNILDGMIAYSNPKVEQSVKIKREIKEQIESQLSIIADGARWQRFIDFVYNRQEKHKENIGTFLIWALNNGFDAVYWTPEKMRSLYPQAFINNKPAKFDKDFATRPPKPKEEEYAPMPDTLKKRNFIEEFNND